MDLERTSIDSVMTHLLNHYRVRRIVYELLSQINQIDKFETVCNTIGYEMLDKRKKINT